MSVSRLPTDHEDAAEQLLEGLHDVALAPLLRIGAAQAHALLAVVDALERLRNDQAALAVLRMGDDS